MPSQILPQPKVNTAGPGVTGPDFSYAAAIPLPNQIGVRDGDDMGAVIGAVKGVAFYADTIGFGEPSSGMSQNMGLKPIGVQVWMKSGATCSNGADMWSYVNGIPQGTALGATLAKGLSDAGMPGLKGLAPGIMEDIQAAFDPAPIMQSVFGTGFPSCKMVEMPVGDQDGRISTVDEKGNKIYYVENPETVKVRGGRSYQSRWTLDYNLSKPEWDRVPKTFCPNGTPKRGTCAESFCGSMDPPSNWKPLVLLAVAGAGICLLTYGMRMRRKS
jgi:hypothetical protein